MDKSKQAMISTLVFVAMLVAGFSFFMPFASVPIVRYSLTGMEMFEIYQRFQADIGDILPLYASLGATILGGIGALVCRSSGSKLGFPLVMSIVCLVFVVMFFSGATDYVEIGYWLFILAHIVSVVLCAYTLLASPVSSSVSGSNTVYPSDDNRRLNLDGYVMKTPSSERPKVAPVTPARWKCLHCNSENPMGKTLCRTCGKPRFPSEEEKAPENQRPVQQSQDPMTEKQFAQQVTVPMASWFCPACGTKNGHSQPFCFNCGFKYIR